MTHNVKLEMEALRSLADLLEQAEKVRGMFEQAGSTPPDALQRLGLSNGHVRTQTAPGSFKPPLPPDADPDWVWVELKSATPETLALAVVKASKDPLTAREIHERVRAMPGMSEVPMGTIANIGTRADENGVITRTTDDGRWQLADQDKAPIIHGDFVWGKPQAFQMRELASYRRNAIIHFLRTNPVGLQITQIVALLRQSEFMRQGIPVNKTLIASDMEAMETQRVRRRGNSRKWEALEETK